MSTLAIDRADTISRICHALSAGKRDDAREIARREYPFSPRAVPRQNFSHWQATQVYVRDGFIDRYFGTRLVFPGALLLLSKLMPEEFPSHPNWKMSVSHMAYWDLYPTLDHVDPVARGGAHDVANWVSTSMIHNSIKDHWTLQELGWVLHQPGDMKVWDGMMHWYLETASTNLQLVATGSERGWHHAAKRIFAVEK